MTNIIHKKITNRYRFALVSDIHVDRENGGKNIYFIHAESNFKRALQVIESRGCDFIISAGDQITNASGAEEEWLTYRSIIDEYGYKGRIYETLGNHEIRSAKYGINTLSECIEDFINYTQLDKKDVIRPSGKPYYSFIEPVFGDAFIFMALENGVDINMIDNFSDEQMDWVERLIGEYTRENRRIILIQHANIYAFGAGDDINSPAYDGALRTHGGDGTIFKNNIRFKKLIEEYRDLVWVSGHTHLDLRDEVNFSDNGGEGCRMLHIPALCGASRLSAEWRSGRKRINSSQGYIVDVDADKMIFSGIDFIGDTIFDRFTYTVPYRKEALV